MKKILTIAGVLFATGVLVSSCSPYYGVARNPNYTRPTEKHFGVRNRPHKYMNRPKKFVQVAPVSTSTTALVAKN
jgi:hypothetical protein